MIPRQLFKNRPAAVLILALCASGCAENTGALLGGTRVGTLKSSVSRLEYENEQLRKEVARYRVDSRDLEDRLAQEEAVNGDLSARLDDARNLLSRRGIEPGSNGARAEGLDGARTLPAGRSTKGKRKAPVAKIPGALGSDADDPFEDGPPARSSEDRPNDLRGFQIGPQSRRDNPDGWLPVARQPAPSGIVR